MASYLHVVQALYGDTFVLEYDNNNGKSGFILVDGGPNKSYYPSTKSITALDTTKNLFDLLTHLSGRTTRKLETINTVVVTHDDADHKNGIAQLFEYLLKKNTSPTPNMLWKAGIALMEAKTSPIENIWYNSQEGLTRQYVNEVAKKMTGAQKIKLIEELEKEGFIENKIMPTLGWFGKFLLQYNDKLKSKVNFNGEIVQPDQPTATPGNKFGVIGKHSTSKGITKGAITVDILGPNIPWSKDLLTSKDLRGPKDLLWKLMCQVKNVSDWAPGQVLDANTVNQEVDLDYAPTGDSASRNRSSIVFRANYESKDGKKKGSVLMLGDAPMSEDLKKQLFPKEYAIVKISHHGSAHNNFMSKMLESPDISGELSWVVLPRGSVLQKAFLYFLTLRAPKYVISASTSFGSPNPHVTTILGIYLAAAARHMKCVSVGVLDPSKWKVDVYMTGRLSANAKNKIVEIITDPEAGIISSLDKFVLPGKPETKVVNYIKDYKSHMTIWKLKQAYGSIGILDGSRGDQWEECDIMTAAQVRKRVHDHTNATGTPNPVKRSRPPTKPKPSFEHL